MTSYRDSHIGGGKGAWYDETHARKFDAVIWDNFIKERLAAELAECAGRGAQRFLDFACGTGRVLKFGSRHFSDATGIDISPDMLEVARQRVPQARLICRDVTRDSDDDIGDFDVVTLFRFLLNAEPALRVDVLNWLARHMPSGAILIGNNHMESWSVPGIVTAAANVLVNRNRNHISRSRLEQLLAQTGFRVERWAGFRVLPTVMGKAVLGSRVQLAVEKLACAVGGGRFGAEHLFVARRV